MTLYLETKRKKMFLLSFLFHSQTSQLLLFDFAYGLSLTQTSQIKQIPKHIALHLQGRCNLQKQ